jgi:oligopeptide transport system permease protein
MRSSNPWREAGRRLFRDPRARFSLWTLGFLLMAFFGLPLILPPFDQQVLEHQLQGPSFSHWMGTDHLGRDLAARVMAGGRISLSIGLLATLVSMVVGTAYGCIAGFYGKKLDQFMMRVVDVLYALPYMFLVIILIFLFGKSLSILFIALGLVQWLTVARVVRGQVLSLKNEEFILAAKCLGASNFSIILRHLVPNVAGMVVIYATLTIPAVILQEAFLSFLGLNVHPCTWGVLIAEGKDYMDTAWWMLVFPGALLTLSLLCLNFLGDGLRDALDPKS